MEQEGGEMTFLIYIMLVKIYCETVGGYADLGMYVFAGSVMWLGHFAVKYLFK